MKFSVNLPVIKKCFRYCLLFERGTTVTFYIFYFKNHIIFLYAYLNFTLYAENIFNGIAIIGIPFRRFYENAHFLDWARACIVCVQYVISAGRKRHEANWRVVKRAKVTCILHFDYTPVLP